MIVKNPPRIALFLRSLGGGGAEKVMLNLGSGLIEQGIEVDLILGKAWGPHLKKVPSQMRLIDLDADRLLTNVLALTRYLKQENPIGLISAMHYANEIALWAKRLARVPTAIMVTEHNTISHALRQTSKIRKYLIPYFVKHFYPWADGIITVSHEAAQDLANFTGLPRDSIRTIYNPVISSDLREKAQQPLDHPWFCPGEPPVILGVGKLEVQKDFPTLIRAFAEVRQIRSVRLIILGWGPDRPQLEALVNELDLNEDVAFLGYVDNPYPYMARSAVFVLSSAWEGLPTVLIEAMAVGTPVVSTNCHSGPSEILDNGKYGFLVPVGDSKALAHGILATLEDTPKTVESSWLEQFTLEAATKQYLEVLGFCQPSETSKDEQLPTSRKYRNACL